MWNKAGRLIELLLYGAGAAAASAPAGELAPVRPCRAVFRRKMPHARADGASRKDRRVGPSVREFVVEDGQVKALKQIDPSGEYSLTRK